METIVGQVVDNYKIIEVIGRGGMGVVFKALDLNLEKTVALKMIDPFLARDENFLKRFKTEAKALAKLDNRNIVNVYALRETEFGLFMVMEYVSAITISEWLKEKGKFSVKETLDITAQLLNAIGHAHTIGVIHRDIKPNNILLSEDGTVKVMDFGLAKVAQDHGTQATVTYAAAGTLYYMSPEQIKGLKNVDKRSDIYSIGMTIYEMLAGRTPFEKSESEFTIQKQIVEGEIPSPLKYNPVIPKELVKFITKSIDKDPGKRFQDVSEMQKELSGMNFTPDDDVTRVISRYDEGTKVENNKSTDGNKNKKMFAGIATAGIIIILLFTYMMFFQGNDEEPHDPKKKNDNKELTEIKKAKLNITSVPAGATVLLDSKVYGKTPLVLDSVEIKDYAVVLKLAGYEDWSNSSFKVFEGDNSINQNLSKIVEEANGTVTLTMDVPGKIYLDGRAYNVESNQAFSKNLNTGSYKIRFTSNRDVSKQVAVDLRANTNKRINCFFKRQLNIQSLNEAGDSFWGNIYVDGENTEIPTPGSITLEAGTHKITVKKTGYSTVEGEKSITINPSLKEEDPLNLVFHLK